MSARRCWRSTFSPAAARTPTSATRRRSANAETRTIPVSPYNEATSALNHTMLYLIMGHDNAKGTLNLRHEHERRRD